MTGLIADFLNIIFYFPDQFFTDSLLPGFAIYDKRNGGNGNPQSIGDIFDRGLLFSHSVGGVEKNKTNMDNNV